jgi:hypothetical protein
LHHGNVMCLAMLQRRVRALCQTRGAFRDIPAESLVAGLPADPVLTAQYRHLILARQNPSDKLHSLVHVTGRFPRHRQVPLPAVQTCHPSIRSTLLPIYPVRKFQPKESINVRGRRCAAGRVHHQIGVEGLQAPRAVDKPDAAHAHRRPPTRFGLPGLPAAG